MEIKRFKNITEKKETKTIKKEDYETLFNEIYDVLEIYPRTPEEAIKKIKEMKLDLDNIDQNVLYFYHR